MITGQTSQPFFLRDSGESRTDVLGWQVYGLPKSVQINDVSKGLKYRSSLVWVSVIIYCWDSASLSLLVYPSAFLSPETSSVISFLVGDLARHCLISSSVSQLKSGAVFIFDRSVSLLFSGLVPVQMALSGSSSSKVSNSLWRSMDSMKVCMDCMITRPIVCIKSMPIIASYVGLRIMPSSSPKVSKPSSWCQFPCYRTRAVALILFQ